MLWGKDKDTHLPAEDGQHDRLELVLPAKVEEGDAELAGAGSIHVGACQPFPAEAAATRC